MITRKKSIVLPIITLIPLLLIALVIFGFSAQTGEQSDQTSNSIVYWIISKIDTSHMDARQFEDLEYFVIHGVRKTAHFLEYAAFGFFLELHLMTYITRKTWLYAGIIGLLYAAGDEIHQLFVSERAMQLSDVFIDFGGAVFGIGALCLLVHIVKKIVDKRGKSP